jgi:hypothetical protein
MKLLGLICTAISLCCGQQVSVGGAEQIVPGFLVAERLEFEGRLIERGFNRSQVLAALGKEARTFQKPKKYTTEKLLSENELVASLAPMFPRMIELADGMARRCGQCWVEGLSLKFGKADEVRVMLMGSDKENVAVQYVVIDHGRAVMNSYRRQFLKDGFEGARYYVTEGGTWRVAERNAIIKIERLPAGGQTGSPDR